MDRQIVSRGRLRPVLQTVLVLVALAFSVVAVAIPPPPPRSAEQLDLPADGSERSVSGEVRAYQAVPVEFVATAGDELILVLTEDARLLVLDFEAPSGLRWIQGARPSADGLRLRLPETGRHQIEVVMTGDAARTGKRATFKLGLRLLRD
jgi:hypothetical protein